MVRTVDRETLRNAGLALLGILAVTLTAATLPNAVRREPSGDGGSGGPGSGDGSGLPTPEPPEGSPGQTIEIPFLTELLMLATVVLALVVLWYLFVHRRQVFKAVIAIAVIVVAAVLVFHLLPFDPSTDPPQPPAPQPNNGSGGGGGSSGTADSPSFPSIAIVILLLVLFVGSVVAVRRRTREPPDSSSDESDDSTADVAAVGRAAGRAADRIEDSTGFDNEVYRAWREMTALLDLSKPETNTPREFEAAAVEAGMERADVRELTELFENVRYGGYEPGPSDEERAVELLRRIEDRYTEEES